MKTSKLSAQKLSTLSLAVAGLMLSGEVLADESTYDVELAKQTITLDRQGSKVKTNVVTLQEKDESTDTDLRGLLSEEPAVDIGGGTGSSQFLTLRGMGQNSVDIKIDNAYSDSQILYHQGRFIIDPSLVKIVAVQKGAGSASAGIGATNGAIITRTVDANDLLKNSERNYGAKLSAGYSSNDGYNYGATVFGKLGAFDALLAYNVTDDSDFKPGDGYVNLDGGDTALYSALERTTYLAKLGANLGKHRFVLSHFKDEQAGTRTIREEFSVSSNARLSLARQNPTYRETSLSNTNLEWTAKDLGIIKELTANAYQMQTERYSADDSACGYCGNVAGPTTTTIETQGANLNLDIDVTKDTLVKLGANYRHQEIIPGVNRIATHLPEKTDAGIYLEAIGDVGDVTLTGGVRYDVFDVTANDGANATGHNINPSFGVIWQATPALSFSANHNYASRSPRLYDALMVGLRRVSVSPDIQAEQARNTEVGFNYNNGNFSLDGSYFWQKVDDVIVNPQNRHDYTTSSYSEAVNDGYSRNEGFEIGASYRYKGFTAKAGVSKSDPQFYISSTSSLYPEFAVPVGRTWTGSLSYRFARPNLEIGWRNRTVEESVASALAGGADETREGYSINDVFANWKPYNNDRVNVNFSINNIADEFYYPQSQRSTTFTYPGVGREFRVGVNYQF